MVRRLSVFKKVPYTSRVFYYYFSKIKKELKEQHWKRENLILLDYEVKFSTTNIIYCHDAITMVKRAFSRMGWDISLQKYASNPQEGHNDYVFMVKRK